jgi:hypothetical protein
MDLESTVQKLKMEIVSKATRPKTGSKSKFGDELLMS